jgi:hypothetical protein
MIKGPSQFGVNLVGAKKPFLEHNSSFHEIPQNHFLKAISIFFWNQGESLQANTQGKESSNQWCSKLNSILHAQKYVDKLDIVLEWLWLACTCLANSNQAALVRDTD